MFMFVFSFHGSLLFVSGEFFAWSGYRGKRCSVSLPILNFQGTFPYAMDITIS